MPRVSSETLVVYSNMKQLPVVGDIVKFKDSGMGLSKVVSIKYPKKGKPLYHVETLDGEYLIATHPEFIEKLDSGDTGLVKTLDSVGLL